jgi:[CysO sulfur-carrier protein]-S-L-cysteine hydrolase
LSTPFCLLLPEVLYWEILAQARTECPKECCGLLAGRVLGPQTQGACPRGWVERRYPLVNQAASPVEFLSEPRSMFAAVRDMNRRRIDILAVYHSHPTSEPLPSRTDRERSYSPEVMNLIVSLAGIHPVMRAWWLTADDYREGQWSLRRLPFRSHAVSGMYHRCGIGGISSTWRNVT